MNETELLNAFRNERSEAAFTELVRRYANLVYSVAKRRLANASHAEDITQLVFIRFAKNPPPVQTHAELVAWLHRTTLNVTIDTWRSETRRRNREQQAVVMEPTAQSVWEDIAPNLDEALNQLHDDDRQAILLRFFGQKTMRDVGAAFGVTEAAAKMRVSRAVDRLRTQLGIGGAALTVATLDTLLTEHSVEAAPTGLISRLAALGVPAIAGATAQAGLFSALTGTSALKLAAGAVVLASIAVGVAHVLRSPAPSTAQTISQSSTESTAREVGTGRRPAQSRADDLNSSAAPPAKAVKIMFHVLDADTGAPLPGTKIGYAYFGIGGKGEGHDTVTDNKGDAAILEPDDSSKGGPNVFINAEGHVPKAVGFRGTQSADYTIRLDTAMTVSGIIVDEQGNPVNGVKIVIQGHGNEYGKIENIDFQSSSITNRDDGTWSLNCLPKAYTNEIQLFLKKPGYASTDQVIPVAKVGVSNLVLVIDRGYTVTGKVTDPQGRPIADARVKMLSGNPNKRQSTKIDDDGFFAFVGIAGEVGTNGPGYHQPPLQTNETGTIMIRGLVGDGPVYVNLAVQASGFASQMKTLTLTAPTNTADFTLPLGNVFRGRVVDESGKPISSAVVQTDWDFDGGSERRYVWSTHTDAAGRFEWNSAPAEEMHYWIEAEGYKVLRDVPFTADDTEHVVTLKTGH